MQPGGCIMNSESPHTDVNVRDRILRSEHEVFSALVNPDQISQYFVSRASAPMKAGATVEWEFGDVGAKLPVDVIEVEEDRRIVFEWSACGPRSRVTVELKPDDPGTTVIAINESTFPMDLEGVKRA